MTHLPGPAPDPLVPPTTERDPEELQRLVTRLGDGDAAALEALFRALYEPLCGVARGVVRSATDAEDIVEETFLKLWMQRGRLRVRGSVRSYLTVAVRNTALNHLERRRTESRYVALPMPDEHWLGGGSADDAEHGLLVQERAEHVRRAIEALPARTRETYCLYYHRRLSYVEIGATMGVSPRTVEAQLVRAVKLLTRQLGGVLE